MNNLIQRLDVGEKGNVLDVLIEVALFQPDTHYSAVRANAAGTKVIYTRHDGSQHTCWAQDWTENPEKTAETLRSTAYKPTPLDQARAAVASRYPQSFHQKAILSGDWDAGELVRIELARTNAGGGE